MQRNIKRREGEIGGLRILSRVAHDRDKRFGDILPALTATLALFPYAAPNCRRKIEATSNNISIMRSAVAARLTEGTGVQGAQLRWRRKAVL